MRSVLAKPSVLTGLLVGLAGSVIEPVVVLYLLRVADLHPSLVGIAIGTGAIGGILGGVAIGPLTERFGHWPSLTLGIVSMALGTVLLLVLGPISGLGFVAGIVFELGTAVGGTITLAGIMGRLQERTDPRRISVTMSVASVSLELIGLGAIAVGAILAELFALDVPLIASLAIYAVVLIGIAIGAWSRHRRRSSP
ncbi:MAG: hypothetical protein L0G99_17375 [Propionibacteriales bacterium]|nr:hypothetical protein [Propionibacteriales bacterium]